MALHQATAKQVMEKLSEIVVTWLRAQLNVLTDAEMILLTDDIAGLMSPDMYKALLLPVHQRIRELFPEMLFLFHNDTASDHLLDILPETGFDVFQLGPTTSLAKAAERVGTRMTLMGNIDPVHILQNGTVEDVISASHRCLDEVGGKARFILSPGGGMNQDIERSKIEAMLNCCRERARR
jgi:uroporphyrinogen decarboxylase